MIEASSGKKLGEVFDLNISTDGVVKGILVQTGAIFKSKYFVPIKHVSSFGPDGIMLENEQILEPLPPLDYSIEHYDSLDGRMVMTSEGERLGIFEDVYFLEEVGTIIGYELSNGFFSDISEGKRVVKTDQPPAIGKDAIIIHIK